MEGCTRSGTSGVRYHMGSELISVGRDRRCEYLVKAQHCTSEKDSVVSFAVPMFVPTFTVPLPSQIVCTVAYKKKRIEKRFHLFGLE